MLMRKLVGGKRCSNTDSVGGFCTFDANQEMGTECKTARSSELRAV